MAQLWGGRFTKELDSFVNDFNASILFDCRMFRQDIDGSIAHVTMLTEQGILTQEEKEQIVTGLLSIKADLEEGKIEISTKYEDIHSLVESQLIDRIGEVGKKLHTGRSRNDQAVTDVKMYLRVEIEQIRKLLVEWIEVLVEQMEKNVMTVMPGFTHLQKAQPVTLAHHLGVYVEMALRDIDRLDDTYRRMNVCPLGAAALAGTSYPLNRQITSKLLKFDRPTRNSMDSVSDRDHICELAFDLSSIMMHLSRISEELILWSSNDYQYIELDDAFCTGSSIMPQKKNPDVAELVRGKTGRVYGALMSLLTMMKGLPLSFSKDMQEDKEVLFDAIDTVKACLVTTTGEIRSAVFHNDIMEKSAAGGFINATDVADYLVKKGMTFRDAHEVSGQLVLACIDRDYDLSGLSLDVYKEHSALFEEDIYEAIDIKNCVMKRNTQGAPSPERVEEAIEEYKSWLKGQK